MCIWSQIVDDAGNPPILKIKALLCCTEDFFSLLLVDPLLINHLYVGTSRCWICLKMLADHYWKPFWQKTNMYNNPDTFINGQKIQSLVFIDVKVPSCFSGSLPWTTHDLYIWNFETSCHTYLTIGIISSNNGYS